MWDKLVSMMGGNLFTGVTDLVKVFKLPPEQQLQFEQKLAELEANTKTSLESIAANDRNSARQREMAVKDHTPAILAYIITAGFFGILAFMLLRPIPETGHDALMILLGSLGTAWVAVVSYYYGSTSSSQTKTHLLANSTPMK